MYYERERPTARWYRSVIALSVLAIVAAGFATAGVVIEGKTPNVTVILGLSDADMERATIGDVLGGGTVLEFRDADFAEPGDYVDWLGSGNVAGNYERVSLRDASELDQLDQLGPDGRRVGPQRVEDGEAHAVVAGGPLPQAHDPGHGDHRNVRSTRRKCVAHEMHGS